MAGLLFQQTLEGLDPKEAPGLDKARRNIADFAEEVIMRIMAEQSDGADSSLTVAVGA